MRLRTSAPVARCVWLVPILLAGACTGVIDANGSDAGSSGGFGKPGSSGTGGSGGPSPSGGSSGGTNRSGGSNGNGATNGSGGSPSTTPLDCSGGIPLAKSRVWRLTYAQIANTLRDTFAFVPSSLDSLPIETRLDGFANQSAKLTVAPLLAESFFAMGEELGATAAANPTKYGITCDLTKLAAGTCLNSFISTAGQKMWRRPLTQAEVASFSTLFTATAAQGGPGAGVGSVMQAMLLSPSFLHRTELGTVTQAGATTSLTDYEIASSLSYLLWDTSPDDELMTLAGQSKLHDPAVLLAQAKRLFGNKDKAGPAVNNFLQQWLRLENLSLATKDDTMFPSVAPEATNDLQEELRLFTNSIFFDAGGDHSFKTLFTATYTFVNARTAPLYGIAGVTGTAMVRRDLDASQRRGVISMVPFLWGRSHAADTNLVGRGSYFRSEVLCHRVPLPQGGVPAGTFAPPNSTGRERLEIHAQGGCRVCHDLFDGIGFALENYDAVGQWRTTEYGKTIDPSGTLPLPSEGNALPGITFSNFVDMVDQLKDKPDVYGCFAQQYASYASGRDIPEMDACEKAAIVSQFAKASYKLDDLMLAVVASPNFVNRKN